MGNFDEETNKVIDFLKSIERFDERLKSTVEHAIAVALYHPTSKYTTISHIKKAEKTIAGCKFDPMFREEFNIQNGLLLDCIVEGIEFDCKLTVANSNWDIPKECVGHIGLLIAYKENTSIKAYVGKIHEEYLRKGKNRDSKRSLSAAGRKCLQLVVDIKASEKIPLLQEIIGKTAINNA